MTTFTGSQFNDTLFGSGLSDFMFGLAGNDSITADGSTSIQVDRDGQANGVAFVDMAVLQGVSTDVNGLLNNGSSILVD
jgi:hypothetical protein